MRHSENTRIVILAVMILLGAAVAPPASVRAQVATAGRPAYGLFGHVNLNSHTADFRALPGTPSCCPQYEDGSGTGFSIGGIYEWPLGGAFLLQLRAGYVDRSALLKAEEGMLVSGTDGPIPGTIEHSIDASISSLGLEPLGGYAILPGLSAWLGVHAGYVLAKRFEQRELLIEPSTAGTFENGLRTRNEQEGDIPDASAMDLSLLAGLSYALPLNDAGTLSLVPEVFYSYGLTGIVKDLTWNANMLRAGLSLRYSPLPSAEAPPAPPPPPPVTPPPVKEAATPPALSAAVNAKGVTGLGVEEDVLRVTVEEYSELKQRPLLNYVFFDENASTLDSRYERLTPEGTKTFTVDSLHYEETLHMYHHLLNIVGRRMQIHHSSRLRLVGCNSGMGTEAGDTDLSRRRAETVRDYLVSVWEIDPERIVIESRNLPDTPSSSTVPDGVEENRRVELYSDTYAVLEPLTTKDVLRVATPPTARFHMNSESGAGVKNWQLDISQRTRHLTSFDGAGAPPGSLDWRIAGNQKQAPRDPSAISYTLRVTDNTGQSFATPLQSIPVELVTLEKKRAREVVNDMEIGHYSLILFDFNSSELNAMNRRIGEQIRSGISLDARVTITGYTDRMGETAFNDKLSRERAHSAAEFIGARDANITGMGERVELYDNDLPEGRFYSRTVDIMVETPVHR